MKKIMKLAALWFCLGAVYYLIEICWRVPRGEWPHWTMWIVGGLCGVAAGAINQHPRFFNLPVWLQSLAGTAITLAVELASGLILNRWLGLGIWDYTGLPGNVLGQICLPFAAAWFLLMPFAIWLEDRLRWGFGWDGKKYSLGSIYLELLPFLNFNNWRTRMDTFTLTITEQDRILTLKADMTELGSQYDHKAQKLVFVRPEGRDKDNLILYFMTSLPHANNSVSFAPADIGKSNEFVITNALTQGTSLKLQVAFSSQDQLEHSNEIGFTLRKSLSRGRLIIEPWKDPVRVLTENAFTGATYKDSVFAFQNFAGDEVASVIMEGGVGGTSDHAQLTNLGYDQSGHIGFASAADLALKADSSALAAHVNDSIKHTTQGEKDAIALIPSKIQAANIKAGSNITVSVAGNDVTVHSTGASSSDITAAISAHNISGAAHSDIRADLSAKATPVQITSAVTAHDTSDAAHNDIRTVLAGKANPADITVAVSAHDSNASAHSSMRTAINDKASPSDVNAAVAAHNNNGTAHGDMRSDIAGKATPQNITDAVSAHNNSGTTHGDIRTAINGKASPSDVTATVNTAITTHNSDSGAHSAQFAAKLDKSGGTLTGQLNAGGTMTETVAQVRDSVILPAGTTDFSGVPNNTLIFIKEA